MTMSDQYTSTICQTQQIWADTVESLTNELPKAFPPSIAAFGFVDPASTIDQVFDFWGKALVAQRDIAKALAGVGLAVGETLRAQVSSLGEATRPR